MLKQLGKGAAAVGVAAVLATTMTLQEAAPAEAFLPALLAAPLLVGGTGMTLAGVLGTTSFITAAGWGLVGTAAIGAGAYATRDWWVPIVTGDFGEPVQPPAGSPGGLDTYNPNPTAPSGYLPQDDLTLTNLNTTTASGFKTANVNVQYNGSNSTSKFGYTEFHIFCKRPDGSTYMQARMSTSATYRSTSRGPFLIKAERVCQPDANTLTPDIVAGLWAGPLTTSLFQAEKGTAPGSSSFTVPVANSVQWGQQYADSAAFDPKSSEVKYKTTVECIRPDGSLFEISAESLGSDGPAVKFPSCDARSPGSHSTMKQSIEALVPGKTEPQPLWSMPSPAPEADKPLCDVRKPGSPCKLAVKLDGQPCIIGSWECENWTSLARDPNQNTRLSCQYGPYMVPLETCNPLERAYEPGGSPATDPNTDGNPDTRSDTDPNGELQPKDGTGTGTSTGTAPGPNTATTPGAAGAPAPGSASEGCFPGGWAMFNPMWIVDGIRCSFIPRSDINTRVETMRDTAATKAPISWFDPEMTGPSASGCPNWVINVPGFSQNIVCGSSFTAAVVGSRGALFGLVAGAMVWPLFRSLWYAAIPILRVTPSSSK